MKIWVDAQLSPAIAAWINRTFQDFEAESVRSLGLRDATDSEIFEAAKEADVIVMSKDDDFIRLIEQKGVPPKLLWITCGNTSNARMRDILTKTLLKATDLLKSGENVVEISDKDGK
jgi:predicted nuclease of predicted toxin-antitoxin system